MEDVFVRTGLLLGRENMEKLARARVAVFGVTVYPLEEYTEELAGRNEIVKQDASFSLDYCLDLVEEVFGGALGVRAGTAAD